MNNATTPLTKIFDFLEFPEAPLTPNPNIHIFFNWICMKDYEIWLDIAGFQFYKPLVSKLHPAGAFSPVKTAFLRILNMYNRMLNGFGQYFRIYKSWMSKLHPAGVFPPWKLHSWIFEIALIWKTKDFNQGGCRLIGMIGAYHPNRTDYYPIKSSLDDH